MLYGAVLVVEVCLVVYCVLSILPTPADQVRTLPKLVWLVLVLLFPLVGGVGWLVAGRPKAGSTGTAVPPPGPAPAGGRSRPVAPDDDEEFLRVLRQRAEEQRRRAREGEPEE